jgi:hypothetical protein
VSSAVHAWLLVSHARVVHWSPMRIGALLTVLVFGCGPERPAMSDAPNEVDSADAPVAGVVSVTVRSQTHLAVIADAPVVFTDTSGTFEVRTDINGHAEASVSPGASVTVMFDDQHFATIVDVEPGDQLTFGAGRMTRGNDLSVTFTAYGSPGAAYSLFSPCLSNPVTPPTSTFSLQFCNGPITSTDVYVVAWVSNVPVATAGAHNVNLTSGSVTITEAWIPMKSLQLDYSGLSGDLSGHFSDVPERYSVGGSVSGASMTLSVPTSSLIQLVRTHIQQSAGRTQTFIERISPSTTFYTVNASEVRPWVTSVTYDAATRTVSSVAPGLTGDIVDYRLLWGQVQNPYVWDVYAPTFAPRTLPILPAGVPDPSTNADGRAFVTIFDTPSINGWDEARPRVYELVDPGIDPAMVLDKKYRQDWSPEP